MKAPLALLLLRASKFVAKSLLPRKKNKTEPRNFLLLRSVCCSSRMCKADYKQKNFKEHARKREKNQLNRFLGSPKSSFFPPPSRVWYCDGEQEDNNAIRPRLRRMGWNFSFDYDFGEKRRRKCCQPQEIKGKGGNFICVIIESHLGGVRWAPLRQILPSHSVVIAIQVPGLSRASRFARTAKSRKNEKELKTTKKKQILNLNCTQNGGTRLEAPRECFSPFTLDNGFVMESLSGFRACVGVLFSKWSQSSGVGECAMNFISCADSARLIDSN